MSDSSSCPCHIQDLESVTVDRLMRVMMQPVDHRFVQPTPETLRKASPHLACHIISQHLLDMANVEISIIGDFISSSEDVKEFESLLLKYLGTIPPRPSLSPSLPSKEEHAHPLHDTPIFEELLSSRPPIISLASEGAMQLSFSEKARACWFHMKDDAEACYVCLGFPTLNRWGHRGRITSSASPLSISLSPHTAAADTDRRAHVLFKSRAMNLLTEVLSLFLSHIPNS